jgi:hypothetical protein
MPDIFTCIEPHFLKKIFFFLFKRKLWCNFYSFSLKSELLVKFSDTDMAKDSVYDLHQYMYALQLSCVFPQIFKLCELVLTIPATSAADERSFSGTLKKEIKKLFKKFAEPR